MPTPDDADLDDHLTDALAHAVPPEVSTWVDGGAPASDDPDSPEAHARRWAIESEEQASWALAKLARTRAVLARVDRAYHRRVALLDEWRATRSRDASRTAAYFEERLARWGIERRRAKPTGPATFLLPEGKVRTSRPTAAWTVEIADEEALLAWALADGRDEFLRPKLQTLTEIRKAVTVADKGDDAVVLDPQTGLAVPGLVAEATEITATVTPVVLDDEGSR